MFSCIGDIEARAGAEWALEMLCSYRSVAQSAARHSTDIGLLTEPKNLSQYEQERAIHPAEDLPLLLQYEFLNI